MKLVDRDSELIRWLNGWGTTSVKQVSAWMGVRFQTAARRVSLLEGEGLLTRADVPLIRAAPLMPTLKGCRCAADDLPPLSGVRLGTYQHDALLIDLARFLSRKFGGTIEPGRRIRHRDGSLVHVPDAILHRDDHGPVAIELELSVKSPRKLERIVESYKANMLFEEVWYVTDSAEVVRALKRATKGESNHIKIATISRQKPSESGVAT